MNVSPAGSGEILVNGTVAPEYPHTYSSIPTGSQARLTVRPANGYVFSYWGGAYNGVSAIVDLTLSCTSTAIVAYFVQGRGVIYGTAFADQDGDGIRDPAETGIAGIRVDAFNGAGAAVGSADTSTGGGFRIAVAEPGDYSLTFSAPYGAQFSSAWYGIDQGLDSDADPATGHTRLVSITDIAPEAELDAGYRIAPSPPAPSDPALPDAPDSGGGGCFVNTIF